MEPPAFLLAVMGCIALASAPAPAQAATYYVSTTGNDANSGTSPATAWQTIARVNSAAFLPGQTLAFKGGNTFLGCVVIAAATNLPTSSATNVFTISSYGAGAATIASNCPGADTGISGPKSAAVEIDSVSGIVWNGVNVSANGTATQYGVLIQSSSGNAAGAITVENATISGFHLDSAATGDASAEIAVLGYATNGVCGALSRIYLVNNTLQGASGPTSPDDAGIGGYGCTGANTQNISTVLYQGNTVFNMGGRATAPAGTSGNGIVLNSVNGGIAQYNRVYNGGANTVTCGGPGGIWDYNSNRILIQYNEVYGMTYGAGCDGAGYDIDNGATNTIVQYNYAHDNKGPGFETTLGATSAISLWGPNTIRYNISENDDQGATSSSGGALSIGGSAVSPSVINVYNNTVFEAANPTIAPACIAFYASPSGGVVANNICWMGAGLYGNVLFYDFNGNTTPHMTFVNNAYYAPSGSFAIYSYGSTNFASFSDWAAAAPGGEAGSIITDPGFSAPPPAGKCAWTPSLGIGPQPCPGAYQLTPLSAAAGVGLDLTASPFNLSIGSTDYYGASIPSAAGTGFDIGADGAAR